jgi:hypothetical protein
MTDNAGTNDGDVEVPAAEGTSEAPPTSATQTPDEVTRLKSRAAGLDAKVTELSRSEAAAKAERDAALARLNDYEAGKVGNDEALKSQLQAKDAELAEARREASVARLQATYPESYLELGDAIANLTPEKLASIEARLSGVPSEDDSPTPRRSNPARTPGTPTRGNGLEDLSIEDLKAKLRADKAPANWLD